MAPPLPSFVLDLVKQRELAVETELKALSDDLKNIRQRIAEYEEWATSKQRQVESRLSELGTIKDFLKSTKGF